MSKGHTKDRKGALSHRSISTRLWRYQQGRHLNELNIRHPSVRAKFCAPLAVSYKSSPKTTVITSLCFGSSLALVTTTVIEMDKALPRTVLQSESAGWRRQVSFRGRTG
ncbi:hypothetical protein K437DRAFT_257461 [Tilletiaria anomala UBC 951]|uniref:Uncharacterized protein n=1 Tax=Tilletiaria anomala (strain ATCC 24038 / CBS 436.72 / UBC 951) TaxID=1037660 RepID=A0A066VPZ6_TILAU|nr:uncharacterized protein K437DRAFT_257461 [Tilletiaria anomala UBC 951]KDN43561.1 hypothetical protein K437DRAFT_257461 [Tilletiaria anomala UBC 951]